MAKGNIFPLKPPKKPKLNRDPSIHTRRVTELTRSVSIITLHTNGLYSSMKRQIDRVDQKADLFVLSTRDTSNQQRFMGAECERIEQNIQCK